VDRTRADILAAYAIFLADHAPNKRDKALKYFEMALQASPYDWEVIKHYRAFKQGENHDVGPRSVVSLVC